MKKYKIIYILPTLSPYTIPRISALCEKNKHFDIVLIIETENLTLPKDSEITALKNCKIEYLKSNTISYKSINKDLLYTIEESRPISWQLPLSLLRHKPDLVVVCNAIQLILASLIRSIIKFEIALNVEDTKHSLRNLSHSHYKLKSWIYKLANKHLSFSKMADDYLRSIGIKHSIFRTSWSLDLIEFKKNFFLRESIRESLEIQNRVVFLFSGRLIELKGIMPMLKAWSKISVNTRNQMSLVIVGDGPMMQEIISFVSANQLNEVKIIGRIPYYEMPGYYSMADIMILPTLQDLFSLVVLEAMASSCPVMTTQYNGASELIKDDRTGWLFDSSNDLSIRETFLRAFESRDHLKTMGIEARKRIEHLCTNNVMNKLALYYEELLIINTNKLKKSEIGKAYK